jgi:hypothetical protein
MVCSATKISLVRNGLPPCRNKQLVTESWYVKWLTFMFTLVNLSAVDFFSLCALWL